MLWRDFSGFNDFIFSGEKNIVRQIRGNTMERLISECLFHVSDARGGGDYTVG